MGLSDGLRRLAIAKRPSLGEFSHSCCQSFSVALLALRLALDRDSQYGFDVPDQLRPLTVRQLCRCRGYHSGSDTKRQLWTRLYGVMKFYSEEPGGRGFGCCVVIATTAAALSVKISMWDTFRRKSRVNNSALAAAMDKAAISASKTSA